MEFFLKVEAALSRFYLGKYFPFLEMIKYVSIPRSVCGFDDCHLTMYWDLLELKLLREVY